MKTKRYNGYSGDNNVLYPKTYSVGLEGYGVNRPSISKVFKGSTFGPANPGRKYTKEEIEAWKRPKRV